MTNDTKSAAERLRRLSSDAEELADLFDGLFEWWQINAGNANGKRRYEFTYRHQGIYSKFTQRVGESLAALLLRGIAPIELTREAT